MKIGVLGAGLMGKEAAKDLAHSEGVSAVGLADIEMNKLEAAIQEIGSDKVTAYQVDATNEKELSAFMSRHDVVINALFYTFNEAVAKMAIQTGVHSLDLGGHIGHITDRILELAEDARASEVTIIPDLGVAPGMINILTGYGISKLTQAEEVRIYVGGIPLIPEPPLGYNHVFSLEGLLDHYTDPALIIRDGKMVEVPALSEIETVYFERFGPLEAFHTSGGTSTLARSFPFLKTLEYKTVRYPGHAEKFKLLVDLNLTRNDYEVEVNGQKIKPRDVLLEVLKPILHLGNKEDAVVLKVIVTGLQAEKRKTYQYEMITVKDSIQNVTAMARATAFTISAVAQMIGRGDITKRGVFPPEQIVPGDLYIQEMAKRGVHIKETVISEGKKTINL